MAQGRAVDRSWKSSPAGPVGAAISFFAVAFFAVAPGLPAAAEEGQAFFEEHIRPLLVRRCYRCHSREARELRGELYLDSRAGWQKGGESGPALVPGEPERSLLVRAVRYADEKLRMPPGGKLPPAEVDLLVEWVRRGAPDPRTEGAPAVQKSVDIEKGRAHWAFQPLRRVEPPQVRGAVWWCRTPLDRFILARLEEGGLAPNPPADPRKLARRLSLGLTGLPPDPADVEAFARDPSPEAWERLVDRYLESPHHGERWARHWLDVARFAESHGFEHDYDRPSAYHFRDFVIEALNQDLPYDTFVKWQIAGDEYEPENCLALKATGFLAAGVHSTQITRNQVEKERYDELDDMARTLGTAMLGLTVGCARCHDHKYDPLPAQDYYRFIATFTATVRSEVDLDLEPEKHRRTREAFEAERGVREEARRRHEEEHRSSWIEAWRRGPVRPPHTERWAVVDPAAYRSASGAALRLLEDGSLLAEGKTAPDETYTVVVHTHSTDWRSLRVEALPHPSLPRGGPGRASNGNFALSGLKVSAVPLAGGPLAGSGPLAPAGQPGGTGREAGSPAELKLTRPRATFEQKGLPAAAAVDADERSAWAVDGRIGERSAAAFDLSSLPRFEQGTALTITLSFRNNAQHALGRLRLALSREEGAPPEGEEAPQHEVELALLERLKAGEHRPEERAALLHWLRHRDARWRDLQRSELEHLQAEPRPELTRVLISTEGLPAVRLHTQGEDFLQATHFLRRGDPDQKLEPAAPGYLQVLTRAPESRWQAAPPPGSRTPWRRRALAEWITDVEHGAGPLLARVMVNRLWHHHLGRGLVATPSEFGLQGERPSHPECLEWLAGELIRGGWRLKPLHRLILRSAVYAEDAGRDPARVALDPRGELWWRWQRRRLEAEPLRDSILAVSGLLDRRMFGPGSLEPSQKRRSIYFLQKRSSLIPMMALFDAPDGLQGIDRRPTTTVAPQALLLLNHPLVRECAEAFARSLEGEGSRPDALRAAYRRALGRDPSREETAEGEAFLGGQATAYREAGEPAAERAALADLCQSLLVSNEFVYVD